MGCFVHTKNTNHAQLSQPTASGTAKSCASVYPFCAVLGAIMKPQNFIFFVLISTISLYAKCGEFNFSDYTDEPISQAQSDYNDLVKNIDKSKDMYFALLEKRSFEVTFTGDFTDITQSRISFLNEFVKYAKLDESTAKLFEHQLTVNDSEVVYHFLVQEPLIPYMQKELKLGQHVKLYAILAGKDSDGLVFLINEFKGS